MRITHFHSLPSSISVCVLAGNVMIVRMGKIPRKLKRALLLKALPALGLLFVALVSAEAVLYSVDASNQRALSVAAQSNVIRSRHTEISTPAKPIVTLTPQQTPVPAHPPTPTPLPAGSPAAVVRRVQTNQPVLFITIDDGVTPDQAGFELLKKRGATATLFLNNANIHRHYDYFKQWLASGSTLQNHTDSHPHMTTLPADRQKLEICSNADRFEQVYAVRPTLFRPPYGEYDATTAKAAADCGEKYVVLWSSEVQHGTIKYGGTGAFAPGEIVLLHFTPDLERDLHAVFTAADAQHLQIGKLEDWLH